MNFFRSVFFGVLGVLLCGSAFASSMPGRGYLVDEIPTGYAVPEQGHIVELSSGTPAHTYYLISLTNYDGTALDQSEFADGATITVQTQGGGVAYTVVYSDATWGDGSMLVQLDAPNAFPPGTGHGGTNGYLLGIVPGDQSGSITGDPGMGDGAGGSDFSNNYIQWHSNPNEGIHNFPAVLVLPSLYGWINAAITSLGALAGLVLGGFFAFLLVKFVMRWGCAIDGECAVDGWTDYAYANAVAESKLPQGSSYERDGSGGWFTSRHGRYYVPDR